MGGGKRHISGVQFMHMLFYYLATLQNDTIVTSKVCITLCTLKERSNRAR